MGALLTYYLRDGLAGASEGPNGPKIVLTVTDVEGKLVRQLDASNLPGLHRTPWDLRETGPAPQGGRAGFGGRGRGGQPSPGESAGEAGAVAGRGGRGARSGPLVKPGTYKVTLGKLVDGIVTPVGQPKSIEVVPLEPSNR